MRILIGSHRYAPDVGGTEAVTALLVHAWRRAGHHVDVITASAGEPLPQVWRRPSPRTLCRLLRNCDVFLQSSISLRTAWPLLFFRRPWFVTTHIWIQRPDGRTGWREHAKRWALRGARNLYISRAMAEHIGLPGELVFNPYDAACFRRMDGVRRTGQLIFVGRLVSDKGVDVLFEALARMRGSSCPQLTVVGSGPEEAALRQLSGTLGLADKVRFAGVLQGDALARMLNTHRVLVVPSRMPESFGLVALEGMACGCRVVASAAGGLPEAVGPGGTVFPNGDAESLAAQIRAALAAGDPDAAWEKAVTEHLARHRSETVAQRYVDIMQNSADPARR